MRRILLLFILCSATLGIYAQHGKLSAGTRIIISDREGRFSLEKSKKEMALLKSKKKTLSSQQDTIEPKEEESLPFATPFTLKGQKVVQCWINMTDNDYSGIEALGVLIQTKFDKRVIANIPVNVLEKVAALKNVTKVSVAKKLKKHTYRSRVLTNVDDVLYLTSDAKTAGLLQAYDGTGVVLGIIDTGIQFSHAMFKDANGNSRIKKAYIYDESVGDLVEYSGSAVSSLTYDTADETHGTHTSAIAGGSDYTATAYVYTTGTSPTPVQNAKFGGMAPNADLVLCGLGDELTDANLSACIKNISDYADEVGKPCVISLSLGSHYGPHDGTGDFAEICKQYTGPGKIIVYAASNDAGEPIYHHKNATSTDPAQTVLTTATRSNYNVDYGMATSWARTPGVELAARFFVVNTSTNKIVWTSKEISATDDYAYDDGTFGAEWSVSDTGEEGTALSSYFTAYNNDSEYGYLCGYLEENDLNGKWCFTSLLYYLKPVSNNYKIAISVYPKNNGVSVFVDSWPASYITFTSSSATYNNKAFTAGSDICSVSDESTFPTVISVGSYCSSKYWYGGTSSGSRYSWTNDGVYGQISSFSSYQPEGYGPLGIKLPWITAPGEVILSAYNSGYSASSSYYAYGTSKALGAMSGTSQAAPCVAGITALWLQANPTLTPDKVKTVMKETAITDTYTSGTYASHFGNGKIDALAGVKYILDNTTITPIVRASATKVNFTDAYATKEYSQKVTIRGLYLQEGITLSLSGSDAFTIDQTSITQTEGTATAEVTITFKPLVAGMETATLTLSSTNAESVTVSISGIAEAATPTIITDKTELSFSTDLTNATSETLGVLGSDLRGDVTATLSDENNVFSLSETTVTKADAEEGKELSVTFSPTKAGEYTGTVTLTSPGVAAVTVMLSATATAQPVVDNSETFQLVTDASTLHANDIILVVYGAGSRALSAALSEGNRTSAAVTITDNSIVLDKDNNNVARICLGGNSSAWTFYDTNNTPGYLFNDGADGFLNTQETAGNYAKATISIGSDGNAIVTFNAQGSYNLLSYYIDPDDDGPGGGDITPPIVGAKLMSVGSTSVSECFTFGDAISTEKGYYSVQIYKKKEKVIDVNMDGQLNISDVTMLVDYILGKNPNPCNVSDCDVNGDGVINISDVTALVDKILGK